MHNNYIIKKAFRKYLFFAVLSSLAAPLGMMVDGIIIGNFFGAEAMAASGLVSPIYLLLTALSGVIASGSLGLCGRYIGREQPEQVKQTFSSAMLWSGAVFLCCTAGLLLFAQPIARLLGATGTLIPLTTDYLRGLGLGVGLTVVHLALVEFTKLDGSPALGPISIATMTTVNILLDFCNVFWWNWGLFGISLASSISYLAAVLVCCTHFLRPTHTLTLVKITQPFRRLLELCKTGLPQAGNGICFAVTTALINYRLLFLGGSAALAAFSIQSTLGLFLGAVCLGLGSTTLLLSGIFYGEEDRTTLLAAIKVALREGMALVLLCCALCFIFLKPVVLLFGRTDQAVISLAMAAVACKVVGTAIFGVNSVFINYYQGSGKLNVASFMSITEALPAQAGYVLLLPLFMGVNGVWLSSPLGGITTFAALTALVAFRIKRFPRSLSDYLLLPQDFGAAQDMRLDLTISNDLGQVSAIARQVQEFCRARGVDSRRAHHLALCLEEMADNVVTSAFTDRKRHWLDIRVTLKNDQLLFRLRDDGVPFNPIAPTVAPPQSPNECCADIGILLVRSLATSVDYRRTLGLNNLVVRL